ncbi:MAG: efflux RND transporter periplasmic adaptor subunit [Nitrosomonas sp.]|nr:efflux RND transporter periplasmic adaptor subunit [Nitrosomonas sp.]
MASSTSGRRKHRWLLLCLLIALLSSASVWWRHDADSAYQTIPAARSDIEVNVAAIGTLQPLKSVEIGAQVSGQIIRLHVEVGDTVEKGQLLAEIDARVSQATVDAGRAQLAGLRAQLADQRAQHELAKQQYARQQQMEQDDATRLEDVQVAAATLKSAAARIDQLQAQIQQVSSTLKGNETLLGFTRIYAPIAGVVVGIDVKEGQTLNATYQIPTVLRVADLTQMTVWTDVSEADIRQIKVGMPVYFTTLGGDRRRWRSTVRQILPAPPQAVSSPGGDHNKTPTAGTKAVQYTVLFDVDNSDGELMPQMTAQVVFIVAHAGNVLTVPVHALVPVAQEDPSDVYQIRVLDHTGKLQVRALQLGVRNRLQVEVVAGLEAGEQIVIGEQDRPQSGRFRW